MEQTTGSSVETRIIIISDTHGEKLSLAHLEHFDVAIHCGDMTEESKLAEFEETLKTLRSIKAPAKLVIAGNHDFTLDVPTFKKKLSSMNPPLDDTDPDVRAQYGAFGQVRSLLESADDITFLDEGMHTIDLPNGARIRVYASPFTPGTSEWGFQFSPADGGHFWAIENDADLAITHCPPRGVLDYTSDKKRAGDAGLFAAIAHAQPRVHCFGHIHESWGGRKVAWRENLVEIEGKLSHLTAIDNAESETLETLATLHRRKFDSEEDAAEKRRKWEACKKIGYCAAQARRREMKGETLFLNAAVESLVEEEDLHLPWVVEIDLPKTPEMQSHSKKRKKVEIEKEKAGEPHTKRQHTESGRNLG